MVIWSICISIDACFNAEAKTGFKFNVGPLVLMLCQIKYLFLNNFQYMNKEFKRRHIFGHSMRTNGPTLNLNPVLASALKYASIEIHIDHITMYFLKKVPKFYICRILQYIE